MLLITSISTAIMCVSSCSFARYKIISIMHNKQDHLLKNLPGFPPGREKYFQALSFFFDSFLGSADLAANFAFSAFAFFSALADLSCFCNASISED